VDESVIMGDKIKIKVLGISRNQVRLGLEAPEEISIHREEIYKRIHENEK